MYSALSDFKKLTAGLTKMLGAVALSSAILVHSPALAAANEKYAAIVVDANNGEVLFSRYADEHRYPASLTKMMTLYLLFEAIERGQATLSTRMEVSSFAASEPPSKLGLKPGSTIAVEEAIYALVVKSANDVATVVAEFLSGTEAQFAKRMTEKARVLGMSRTTFKNAHGLPDSEQVTTARDMATLGIALREHFPQYYHYFSARSFDFRGRTVNGHNRVLGRVKGADGIKTGYISAAGFQLVSSVVRGDKSLVAVVMGGRSGRSRDDHMVELLTRYLPQASEKDQGPLLTARAESPWVATFDLPKYGPVPAPRSIIDRRIAMAYDSSASQAIPMLIKQSNPLVGRKAIATALAAPQTVPQFQIPAAATSLAPTGPVPPAAIPGGVDLDPTTTGSVEVASLEDNALAEASVPSSPWVVQIAATPEREQALEMLSEIKAELGGVLAEAEPFTETVRSNGQTLYRARYAGFQTKDEAWDACAALKRQSHACYAVAQ